MQSLDDRTLIYPEYRGNGVLASVGNILGNPHIGMLFVDFVQHSIGLHANGSAEILETDEAARRFGRQLAMQLDPEFGRKPELWVLVTVSEAYIHCSKHIPRYSEAHKAIHWGPQGTTGEEWGISSRLEIAPARGLGDHYRKTPNELKFVYRASSTAVATFAWSSFTVPSPPMHNLGLLGSEWRSSFPP